MPDRATPDLEVVNELELKEQITSDKRMSLKRQISVIKEKDAKIIQEGPEVCWIPATENSKSDDIHAIGIILYEMASLCPSLSIMY